MDAFITFTCINRTNFKDEFLRTVDADRIIYIDSPRETDSENIKCHVFFDFEDEQGFKYLLVKEDYVFVQELLFRIIQARKSGEVLNIPYEKEKECNV